MSNTLQTIDTELAVARLPADQNPALVYLAGLNSPHSRRTMREALDTIAGLVQPGETCETFPWSALRFQHTQAIRAQLTERYAPATANKFLSALRGVLKAARRLGQMSAEDCINAIDLKRIIGETLPAGRDLDSGEIAALMTACERDPSAGGPRDAAIIGLLAAGGLRRAEIVALDLDDYDRAAGRLVVCGKRNKQRTVYITGGVSEALADWLIARGEVGSALFTHVDKAGGVHPRRLSAQAIYDLCKKRATEAGVKAFSPHDLRRTFVGDLLDAGVDISTVASMAGHENVQTTMRYDRRPEETKRKAAGLLHVPYRRRWHD